MTHIKIMVLFDNNSFSPTIQNILNSENVPEYMFYIYNDLNFNITLNILEWY